VALDRGGAGYAWVLAAAMLALVLRPVCQHAGSDSFPFSSYPMFALGRPSALSDVHHLVAFDAAGVGRPVPPKLVANDEVLQAEVTLHRAVRAGRKTSAALCKQVAARLADDPAWSDIVRLELLSDRYDALVYFAGDTAPIRTKRRARCKVPRA